MEGLLVLSTAGTYLRVPEQCWDELQTHQADVQCALACSEWGTETTITLMLTDLPFSCSSLTVCGK